MPTIKARHTLTETQSISEAIDDAVRVWPELENDRGALLRKLVEAGHRAVVNSEKDRIEARRRAIREHAGAATGAFPADAAERLKDEWPR